MSDAIPERWLPIAGFEGLYEVSYLGRVRSLDRVITVKTPGGNLGQRRIRGCLMKQARERDDYLFVGLWKGNKQTHAKVHLLVLEAFHEPRPYLLAEGRHLNGDNQCNAAWNLAWGTKSENVLDQVQHGTHRYSPRTSCDEGHEFTPENTMIRSDGGRRCLTCKRKREREAAARRRARAKRQREVVAA